MTKRQPPTLRFTLALLVLLAACHKTSAPATGVISIAVSPSTATLAIGKTETLSVTGTYANGQTAPINNATFSSSAPSIATVSDAGLVTAVAAGSATFTVSAAGFTATAAVTVAQVSTGGPLIVFDDNYGAGVSFNPFGGSVNPPTVDTTVHHAGTASLKIVVPASGYSGGAFPIGPPADLSGFNAVTFWAMASVAAPMDKAGMGNDSSQTLYQTELLAIPLTTSWTQFVIPLPLPAKLTAETGVFHYAVSSTQGTYNIWLDDIQYEKLPATALGAPTASIATTTLTKGVGDTFTVPGLSISFPVNGAQVAVVPAPGYFTFTSSNTAVATVSALGVVSVLATGSANITAALGSTAVTGTVTVNVGSLTTPSAGPPTPTPAAANVISLLSDAYSNVTIGTFAATWQGAAPGAPITIAGAHLEKYMAMGYAGIDFGPGNLIDATNMTHVHVDIWTPDSTSFGIKLVDFGADGAFGGTGANADSEFELDFNAGSTPKVVSGKWIGFDLPLAKFTGLASRTHLAQIILIGSGNATLFMGNLYFYKAVPQTTYPVFADDYAANVSLLPFSGADNTGVSVDTAQHHSGTASLKVVIPATGFTGGALVSGSLVDVSGFDSLTFWAMASTNKTIDKVGFNDDANVGNFYSAELHAVALTTTWTKYTIPVPLAAQFAAIDGLFHFATSADASGVTIWFDDIQYENSGAGVLGAAHPAFTGVASSVAAGTKVQITGTTDSWFLNGGSAATTLYLGPVYFTFSSSNATVASVSPAGQIKTRSAGHADITGMLGAVAATGTISLDVTGVAPAPTPLPVFTDAYGTGMSFAPFGGSVNPPSIDTVEHHTGTSSLKVALPSSGYTGGAIVSSTPLDLSDYDSVTFWAKASANFNIDKVGFGNDTVSTTFACEWAPVPLTTTWTKYVVPLPNPVSLTSLAGLFHYATGSKAGSTIWFDDIQYEQVGSGVLGTPSAAISGETVHLAIGGTHQVASLVLSYSIAGNGAAPTTLALVPANAFTFTSSNPSVATVDANGKITAHANGTASITAKVGSTAASGTTTITVP